MRRALKRYVASTMPLDDWRALSIFMQRCAGRRNIPKGSEFIDQLAFCKALQEHDHMNMLIQKLRDNISQRGGAQKVLCSLVDAHNTLHQHCWVSGKYQSGIGSFVRSELDELWRVLAGTRSQMSANKLFEIIGESKSLCLLNIFDRSVVIGRQSLLDLPEAFKEFALQINNVGKPQTLFDDLDRDKRSYVTRHELEQGCARWGMSLAHEHFKLVMKVLDPKNSGTIERSHFIKYTGGVPTTKDKHNLTAQAELRKHPAGQTALQLMVIQHSGQSVNFGFSGGEGPDVQVHGLAARCTSQI